MGFGGKDMTEGTGVVSLWRVVPQCSGSSKETSVAGGEGGRSGRAFLGREGANIAHVSLLTKFRQLVRGPAQVSHQGI